MSFLWGEALWNWTAELDTIPLDKINCTIIYIIFTNVTRYHMGRLKLKLILFEMFIVVSFGKY